MLTIDEYKRLEREATARARAAYHALATVATDRNTMPMSPKDAMRLARLWIRGDFPDIPERVGLTAGDVARELGRTMAAGD